MNNFRFLKASFKFVFETFCVLNSIRNYQMEEELHGSSLFHLWNSANINLIYDLTLIE